MDAALRAIAEPRRRDILRLIGPNEVPAGEIASHFSVSRPAISQHLHILADAGLIAERRAGTRRLYRLRLEGLAEIQEYLASFWSGRLNLLKDAAEAAERDGGGTID